MAEISNAGPPFLPTNTIQARLAQQHVLSGPKTILPLQSAAFNVSLQKIAEP
jgi:hypothetical protein